MMTILDGKALAQTIRTKIKDRITALASKPGLAILLVGEDPASHIYVNLKQKACEEVGIHFEKHLYAQDVSEEELISKIQELNSNPDIHGILVQIPLPNQNADHVIEAIDPVKDVDGFHPRNLEALREGKPSLAPAVALGILKLIDKALDGKNRAGLHTTIVSSDFFADPLQILLREQQISSDVVRPTNPSFQQKIAEADILIIALGRPNLIHGSMIKTGAILIDVGTTKVHGRLVGDIERATVEPVAGALSPVPGGVGPMTVAMLLLNVLNAYGKQKP
ncbi:MAG: bifunctional 5,10-methylenetetrahydrofolate dehydrogenase/5,10-methenyltetrahydrofolate cyclohydrolase [Candidatus Uhrbacteria bacterium]|nr:bifunctional 5,10-methylenetetrahydrofolate dehydrogenase/5,10-methenyltetrahydrofolate cyclohydrolase [Candidatus Uhrbacteria bacterium]